MDNTFFNPSVSIDLYGLVVILESCLETRYTYRMLFGGIFLGELILLFLVSKLLTTQLYLFFYSVTHSQKATVYWIAILFFPGVVVHELAHAFAASFLLVPVGTIEFFPTVLDNRIKLGSVRVGKSDFVRSFFIGVAPVIIGAFIIFGVFWGYFSLSLPLPYYLKIFLSIYLLFEVSNTMFSSKKDLEGAGVFVFLFLALITAFYFIFHPSFITIETFFSGWEIYFRKAAIVMAIPLMIDIVVWVLLSGRHMKR